MKNKYLISFIGVFFFFLGLTSLAYLSHTAHQHQIQAAQNALIRAAVWLW
jgi:hypothetical protein